MRILLQNIELNNFKTYRGIVKVGPLKEFTAVVGPNGSGKSNLLDALSFVLGEDIPKLRVKEASQLIYGANVGRPIATEASVCARFCSEEGTGFTFKRVISRNSVKHFFNEKAVSKNVYLKELEGIGVNVFAKNFLVYQGQVEEVALMDAKQRSTLIEQVSGSIHFKREYDEYKRALALAEDKIHLVFSKQRLCRHELKEARIEREEMIKYEQLERELAVQILKLQLFKLFYNEKEIKIHQEKIITKKSELEEAKIDQNEAEDRLRECKKVLSKGNRHLTKIQMDVQGLEEEIQRMQEPLIKAEQEKSHMSETLVQAQKSLKRAQEAYRNHKLTLKDLKKTLAAVERDLQEYQKTVADESCSQGRDIELEQSQAAQYNDLKVEAAKCSSYYRPKMESLNRQQKADQDLFDSKKRKFVDIEAKIKHLEDTKKEEIQRSTRLSDIIERTENEVTELYSKQQALKADSELYEQKIVSIQKELENISSRIGDAKYDNHETHFEQRKQKAIEALKAQFSGVFGRLMNLCGPIHTRYSIALAKVMGKRLNAIVVDKVETARGCIQYLKEQLMEPEDFLPLDYIHVSPLKEHLRQKIPKGCKLLFDVVNYDPPEVKRAVLFATISVVVCKTADDAQYVAYELNPNKFLDTVSLDGSYFQQSGLISGGSTDLAKKAQSWDDKIIAEMKAQKNELCKELQGVLKKSKCASLVQSVELEARGVTAKLDVMRKDHKESLKKISDCDECIEKLRAQQQILEPEMKEIEILMKESENKLKKLQGKLCSIEDEVFASFCEKIGVSNIREYEESGLRSYEDRVQKTLEFEGHKNRIQNQIEYEMDVESQNNINRWTAEVEHRQNALVSSAAAVEHHEKIIAAAKDNLKRHQDLAAQKKKDLDAVVKVSDEAKSEVRKINEKVACICKQLQNLEAAGDSLKRARYYILLNCKVENINIPPSGCLDALGDDNSSTESLESQQLYNRIVEIEIDYDLLDNNFKELHRKTDIEENEIQLSNYVSKISKKLEGYRKSNLRSEDILKETTEKLRESKGEFKTNQMELKKVKDRFDKIKKARYDLFADCFEFVSNEIDHVYKDLTCSMSASAMIVAENPEEPYLGGIQYSCIASGKAFRHMEDLSGGEKTLASIAFILTMHKYRKAPCLVLDEVDAALDNTNIAKIAGHLSLHKAEFQTVAISLRPEFYGHVDALIGVTREGTQDASEVYFFDLEVFPK